MAFGRCCGLVRLPGRRVMAPLRGRPRGSRREPAVRGGGSRSRSGTPRVWPGHSLTHTNHRSSDHSARSYGSYEQWGRGAGAWPQIDVRDRARRRPCCRLSWRRRAQVRPQAVIWGRGPPIHPACRFRSRPALHRNLAGGRGGRGGVEPGAGAAVPAFAACVLRFPTGQSSGVRPAFKTGPRLSRRRPTQHLLVGRRGQKGW